MAVQAGQRSLRREQPVPSLREGREKKVWLGGGGGRRTDGEERRERKRGKCGTEEEAGEGKTSPPVTARFSTDTQDDGGMALPLVFQRELSAEFDLSSPTFPLYTVLSVLLWFIYKTSVC